MMELSKLNRDNIAKKIGHGAVLLHGGNTVYRNNDVAYDFKDWPQWSIKWCVRGPRKNYKIHSKYSKI